MIALAMAVTMTPTPSRYSIEFSARSSLRDADREHRAACQSKATLMHTTSTRLDLGEDRRLDLGDHVGDQRAGAERGRGADNDDANTTDNKEVLDGVLG